MLCVSCFGWLFLFFLFQKNISLNKLVHAFWLPVSSSHLISVPPTGRDMWRKKWEVSSLVTLLFSVNNRILREICESQTSVISVPDLPLADRAIYRARVLKTHKGRHKTRAIKVIWSFIHILKRMWGLPVNLLAIMFAIKVWCQFHTHSVYIQSFTGNCTTFTKGDGRVGR